MESTLFKNAKFGDKYRTRDGRMAVYIARGKGHLLIFEGHEDVYTFSDAGSFYGDEESKYDIISRWKDTE